MARKKEPWVVPPRPWRVIVAADTEGGGAVLERALLHEGHAVERVTDARAALALMVREPAHCVVLDLQLKGAGGNSAAVPILRSHKDPVIKRCRIVFCGGKGANWLFAWESGIDAFLQHPFHIRDLLSAVEEVITRPEPERAAHRRAMREVRVTARRGVSASSS